MNKYKAISIFLFLLLVSVFATKIKCQQHFSPVNTGNPDQSTNIIIDSALLDSVVLQENDEITFFDVNVSGNEICVGQVSITTEFTADTNYIINASADDPTTPEQDGFIAGNEIVFRYWDNNKSCEIILINKVFDPALDNVYQTQGTAKVGTDGYSYETWTGEVDTVWSTSGNWNFNRVPSLLFDVVIPDSPTGGRFPVVMSQDAKCSNITIEDGAFIKITGKLTIREDTGDPFIQ
jgi:hypothetical protein